MLNFKSYIKDTGGNFSVVMAISMTVMAMGAAAAIETVNMTRVKSELQSQVDIATLAAASTEDVENQGIEYSNLVFDVMVDNGYLAENGKPEAMATDSHLDVTASVAYEGLFTDLLGGKTRQLSASAQATLPSIGPIELVLALDNTASMGFDGKIGALKIGAGQIIDAIEESNSGTKVGIVPFARYVNIGDAAGSWLDTPAEYDTERTWEQATHTCDSYSYEPRTETKDGVEYTYEEEVCNGQTTTYDTRTRIIESRYEGCVGTSDKPDHLSPISSSNRVTGLLNIQPREVTGLSADIVAECPLPIRPLDDDYSEIGDFINQMFPVDVTYIPSGLLWAERLLDRTTAFSQGPKDEDKQQVLVLMTDGKNTAEIRDQQYYQDQLRAPPYVADYPARPERTVEQTDEDTILMCDRIKNKGIEIYTISFQIDDDNAKALVKNCASTESHNFDAGNNDALIEAFAKIGRSLSSNVRLTR